MKRLSSDALCRGAVLPLPHGQAQLRGHPCLDGMLEITVTLPYRVAYGMGEKYDALNQKGHTVCNQVEEKFCFQGEKTYCPAPFFWTDSGFGPYADTREVTRFCFAEGQIHLSLPAGCSLVLFSGTLAQIIRDYLSLFGPVRLPPKWAFGLWVSANHWDSQQKILQVVQELETLHCPATVLVAEAWSDEATFYLFRGARFTPKAGGRPLERADLSYPADDGPWPDPQAMIDALHNAGLHFVLWQIPVYKKQGPGEAPAPKMSWTARTPSTEGSVCTTPTGRPTRSLLGTGLPGR